MTNRFFPGCMRLLEAAGNTAGAQELSKVIIAALLSMVPTFEGRYAITVMWGMGMPAGFAYVLAVVCSTLPMPFILLLLRPVLDWFYTLPIKPVRKFAAWLERRSESKRRKMHANKGKGIRGYLAGKVSEETLELLAWLYRLTCMEMTSPFQESEIAPSARAVSDAPSSVMSARSNAVNFFIGVNLLYSLRLL